MSLNTRTLKSDTLLLTTATIWGFAFVAQRIGMEYVGPFIFNGIRFALGCLVLLPIILRNGTIRGSALKSAGNPGRGSLLAGGFIAGLALFAGSSLQQTGIVYTTAGNAGFITGLYVVIVPILGLFLGQRTSAGTWIGVLMAAFGMYLLSVTEQFTISIGDLLVFTSAFFWAGHVIIIGWLSPRFDSLQLAFIQYALCSLLSLIASLIFETTTGPALIQAIIPILYGGVLSVGIAYTLQVVAQRNAHPAHAAILLSLEAVFAAIGGWIILDEILTPRELSGCALMFSGMIVSQLWGYALVRVRAKRS